MSLAIFVFIPFVLYLLTMLLLSSGWRRATKSSSMLQGTKNDGKSRASLILAIRNESENLGLLFESIESQNMSPDSLEVIFVDDHSDDSSQEQLKEYAAKSKFEIKLLKLDMVFGKKEALKMGISIAQNDLLVFTDGDCNFGSDWISSHLIAFEAGSKFSSGPVMFKDETNLWQRFMQMEFLGLIASGGSSIQRGWNLMANGANMSVCKSTYYEVKEMVGGKAKASGDDVYLLAAIAKQYPSSIRFVKSREAIVRTGYEKTLGSFIIQRLRWSSKGLGYLTPKSRAIAFNIYLVNVLLLFLVATAFNPMFLWVLVIPCFVLKIVADLVFFSSVLPFFKKGYLVLFVIPIQIIHIPYVVLTGFAGTFAKYRWKGRKTK
jgi:poly-beta-1,6-N-acetyl-D-glucosamine synthase